MSKKAFTQPRIAPLQRVIAVPITDPAEQARLDMVRKREKRKEGPVPAAVEGGNVKQTRGVAQINLSLTPDLQKLINERVNSGKYSTPEDVVAAAIMALAQQEQFGDFEAGELDELLAEGERSIGEHGTLDGEEAFRRRGQRRAGQRKSLP